jgi:predicted AlkP superfamily phosphohydrolase/phosphomutase
MRKYKPVVFIGLDAADRDLIELWAGQGHLPNLQRLLEQGLSGSTVNPPGLFVGAVWPGLFTGCSPARHGRYCYKQIKPGTYDFVRFDLEGIDSCEPFWAALDRAGRRVAVCDFPHAPLLPDFHGAQLVDWGCHDSKEEARSTPTDLAAQLTARHGPHPIGGRCNARRQPDQHQQFRDDLVTGIARRTELLQDLLGRETWDFFGVVYSESHCIGHQSWHLHDPEHPYHDANFLRQHGDPLLAVYKAIDASVGRLLQGLAPNVTVVVLASHGMGPHYDGTFLLDEVLQRFERVERGTLGRWWRHLTGCPETGSGLAERCCFQVPNNSVCGGIRLNLVGREPRGRLRRGKPSERFCGKLADALHELINLETGRPLVRAVYRSADVYQGPLLDRLPDLLVEWHRERPVTGFCSPRLGELHKVYPGCRSGDHKAEGLFLATGPGLRCGRLSRPVSVMDFAPTFAHLLEVELPLCDGQVITELAGVAGVTRREAA